MVEVIKKSLFFLSLLHSLGMLDSEVTSSVVLNETGVIVIKSFEVGSKGVQVLLVFFTDLGEGKCSGSLLVDESTESCFSFHEGIRDIVLFAESWEMENKFNWVDIMSDQYKLGFLLFNEGGDMVETEFDDDWFDRFSFFLVLFVLSLLLESLDFLFSSLWLILGEEFESFMGLISVQSVGELSDLRWDLESGHQDSLLSLESDILRPFDESCEIHFVHNVSSNSVRSSLLLEEVGSWTFIFLS